MAKLKNLLKALFGVFNIVEFEALCRSYSEDNSHYAHKLLKIFFCLHALTLDELKVVYAYGDNLKQLYLRHIPRGHSLTVYEQVYMAEKMNFGRTYRFPQRLCTYALNKLFACGDTARLLVYCKDYSLPERFELELVKLCAGEKKQNENGMMRAFGVIRYRTVLKCYLSAGSNDRFLSRKAQNALMDLGNEELLAVFCSAQTMTADSLTDATMRRLADEKRTVVLRDLLFHSFIPSFELQSYIYAAVPELKWELEISKVRHALRLMEIRAKQFWGVEAPFPAESDFICKAMLSSSEGLMLSATGDETFDEERFAVISAYLKNGATPYFCAWAAYTHPQLAEEAYKCLRKFAEKKLQKR